MKFLHFGLRVDNIAASSELFGATLGISWEPIKEYAVELDFAGRSESGRSLVTHGLTDGGVEIEMVQALSGRSPDTEVLGDREGVSHIAYQVDDLDAALARAEERGLSELCSYHSEQVDFAFCDGPGLGGVLLQLVQFHGPRT
jgi:catechol 2,3-dioxygenase-like lactoylglutathione lyase family enzyme